MPLRLKIVSDHPGLSAEQRVREFAGCGGTIGRAPDNDWVLPDDKRYVSSRHAVLDFQGGAYYLVDTSRNGVYINGADTPVGTGHPQRLFDGDRLLIGQYQIKVSITGNDEDLPGDGMRDSIVRAQLVREDPSVEIKLVDESKLLMDSSFHRHITPTPESPRSTRGAAAQPSADDSGAIAVASRPARPAQRTAARPAPQAKASTPAPKARPEPPTLAKIVRQPNTKTGETSEIRALGPLLEGAGLQSDTLSGSVPREVLELSGRLLRATIAGLMDLLRERDQALNALRVPPPRNGERNPLQFAPNIDEALRYLLTDRAENGYLVAEDAIRQALRDIRLHQQAMHAAMVRAARDYADHFDPDELRKRFDRGLKRTGILSSTNKLKYWDLYEESYAGLTQRDEAGPPHLFNDEFVRAYNEEIAESRKTRR